MSADRLRQPPSPTRSADPNAVLLVVQRYLRDKGVTVDPPAEQMRVALITTGDLLRNLGVEPSIGTRSA